MTKEARWLETLPCGCQDVHYSDGSVDLEHDHVQCDGTPVKGYPVLSEPVFGADGNVDFVTEWYVLPPGMDKPFTVTKDYWRDEHPSVREVHAWRHAE